MVYFFFQIIKITNDYALRYITLHIIVRCIRRIIHTVYGYTDERIIRLTLVSTYITSISTKYFGKV
jgi:hypothetical protein